MATYTVSLYKKKDCGGGVNFRCQNIAARQCCSQKSGKKGSDAWSLSSSANYVESGSGKANGNDMVKIYTEAGGEPCGLPSDQSTTCASDGKSIAGAAVVVVVPAGSGSGRSRGSGRGRREAMPEAGPMPVVEPDTVFIEDGNSEYSLKLRSAEGEEFQNLTEEADQVEFLKRFGKRSELLF
jgi:hypothetical protein